MKYDSVLCPLTGTREKCCYSLQFKVWEFINGFTQMSQWQERQFISVVLSVVLRISRSLECQHKVYFLCWIVKIKTTPDKNSTSGSKWKSWENVFVCWEVNSLPLLTILTGKQISYLNFPKGSADGYCGWFLMVWFVFDQNQAGLRLKIPYLFVQYPFGFALPLLIFTKKIWNLNFSAGNSVSK